MSALDRLVFDSLQSALGASQLRQQVYANNIANAQTPGYKRQTVQFESILQSQLAAAGWGGTSGALPLAVSSPRDLSAAQTLGVVSPVVVTDNATGVGNNGNNVNIDAEMSALAQNQIDFGALTQELTDQFQLLKTAILGS